MNAEEEEVFVYTQDDFAKAVEALHSPTWERLMKVGKDTVPGDEETTKQRVKEKKVVLAED